MFFTVWSEYTRLLTSESQTAPARLLFFAPIAKYIDEIFPNPEVSILNLDIPNTDWTGPYQNQLSSCLLLICHHFLIIGWSCVYHFTTIKI